MIVVVNAFRHLHTRAFYELLGICRVAPESINGLLLMPFKDCSRQVPTTLGTTVQ